HPEKRHFMQLLVDTGGHWWTKEQPQFSPRPCPPPRPLEFLSLVLTHGVDPRRMKRARCGRGRQHRGRLRIGATSPFSSSTRSPASTPYCDYRSITGERAF